MIKMWIAVWLVSHAFTFSMAVFDVAQHLVNQAAGVINTSATVSGDQIVQMVEGLKDKGLGELVMILFETSLVKVAIQVMSVVIMLVVYGRMFEIYVYCSVSAIPFATMGNKEWGQIGTNYIKGLFAIGLQGLFLIICLGIYAVLVKTIKITDIHASTFMILGYITSWSNDAKEWNACKECIKRTLRRILMIEVKKKLFPVSIIVGIGAFAISIFNRNKLKNLEDEVKSTRDDVKSILCYQEQKMHSLSQN